MQPYFRLHLGYLEVTAAADMVGLLDSANFIDGGWISKFAQL